MYAKLLVFLGIALPVTDILSLRAPPSFYQGFYLYLYVVSVAFVGFMYAVHLRTRAVFTILNNYSKFDIYLKIIFGSFHWKNFELFKRENT